MSKIIRIDPVVAAALKRDANPGETPNAVIRRWLGLPPRPGPRRATLKPYRTESGAR